MAPAPISDRPAREVSSPAAALPVRRGRPSALRARGGRRCGGSRSCIPVARCRCKSGRSVAGSAAETGSPAGVGSSRPRLLPAASAGVWVRLESGAGASISARASARGLSTAPPAASRCTEIPIRDVTSSSRLKGPHGLPRRRQRVGRWHRRTVPPAPIGARRSFPGTTPDAHRDRPPRGCRRGPSQRPSRPRARKITAARSSSTGPRSAPTSKLASRGCRRSSAPARAATVRCPRGLSLRHPGDLGRAGPGLLACQSRLCGNGTVSRTAMQDAERLLRSSSRQLRSWPSPSPVVPQTARISSPHS